ncbi:MAG: glycosyltransferase [Eubacteriales bacterium]
MISIIIPVYNGEKYIERCIMSICNQTCKDVEIILIDDGSTDNSLMVCQQLSKVYSFITVIHQDNAGVSSARNRGLERANGEYITFVDIDDWLKPTILESMLKVAVNEQSQLTICGFEECRENQFQQEQQKDDTPIGNVKLLNKSDYVSDYLLRGNTRCWSILFTKSVIGNIRFRSGISIGEDMLFLVDLVQNIEKVSVLEEKGYCYFINEEGAMFSEFKESYMDQITCWEMAREVMHIDYPENINRISSIIMISTMLVASKIALLSSAERRKNKEHIEKLKITIQREGENKDAMALLDCGYRIKIKLFQMSESLYFSIYHFWSRIKK